ncbi:hypothetical protein F5Y12DRAFT_447101 [Xylaria sp. FL1777]|nr:hypothetical protein F5Y12DRAFT_447101 [Xylaria sp. FL1777]
MSLFVSHYSVFVSVTVGYATQISLGPETHPTTTPLTLTTVFTPPPACRTPFAFFDNCYNEFECDGSYFPVLYNSVTSYPGSSSIRCLPQTTIIDDSYVDGVYDYNPGLFCPDGMTTDTSIGSAFLCCPSGLTYSYNGDFADCTGTITEGTVLVGPWNADEATIAKTITWSAPDNMTLYVAARPIYLTQESIIIISKTFSHIPTQASSSTIEVTETSMSAETSAFQTPARGCSRKRDCQMTTPLTTPPTNPPDLGASGPSIGIKAGAAIGGAIAFVLLVAGAILLLRYRRKRLVTRHHALDLPPIQPEAEVTQQTYQKKRLPELPVVESRVELEGTQVEDRGPGIYVSKPELEGTAGIPGAMGVYVRKKSELEARHDGALLPSNPVLGTRSRRTTMAPESPVVGQLFMRYSAPR